MKLTLDRAIIRSPIWIYLVILLLCVGLVLMQFPARWVSGFLGDQTACRVVLQDPMGTIWQGSAGLGFSERSLVGSACKPPSAQTERMQWKTHCQITELHCATEIQFAALEKPQTVRWGWGQPLILIANEMTLPATILEGLGNPWITLRPRGDLHAHWTDLTWTFSKGGALVGGGVVTESGAGASAGKSFGVMRIVIRNLASPISPVKPLGSYEIQANLGEQGASWVLSTTAGPLLLKGQGELGPGWDGKGLQFSGEASADPDAEDALFGLLSLLGKKEGNTYRLKL